jgi:Tol biopolymer transport system component
MNDFWKKFKHRNVAKVATVYAALSWFLLQAQEAILPTIGAPTWVAQSILFLMLVGFPIACVIAWASDVNSKDDNFEEPEDKSAKVIPNSPITQKSFLLTGLPVIALIGLFAFYISPYIFDFESENQNQKASSKLQGFQQDMSQSARFELNLGNTGTSEWGLTTEIVISPNGRYVAYTRNNDGDGQIFIRDLWRGGASKQIAEYRWGTDVHGVLDFSEDGEWVTYFDSGILQQVRVSGGASKNLLDARLGRTSGYHLKDSSLMFTGAQDFLWKLDRKSGEQSIIYAFDQQDVSRVYRWPEFLPDEKTILVSSSSAVADSDSILLLYNQETGISKEIVSNAFNGRFVEQTGHIVFVRGSSLWAVPFDLEQLNVSGNEVKLIDNIQTNGILGSAAYSFSKNGRLVYLPGTDVAVASANLDINVVSRSGEVLEAIDITGRVGQLAISPDSSQLSYTAYESSESDIWVWDFQRKVAGRRTFGGTSNRARWSPDLSTLLFNNLSEAQKLTGVWAVPSDGSGEAFEVFSDPSRFSSFRIQSLSAADNRLFFFGGAAQIGQGALWSLDLSNINDSEINISQLEVSPNTEEVWWARIATSPNGRWISYVSNESGSNQIYIRPYPDIDRGKWQISALDAASPIWSANSNEIFFRSGNRFFKVNYEELSSESRTFMDLQEPEFLFEHTIVENHLTFPAYVYNPIDDNFIILSTSDSDGLEFSDSAYKDQTTLTVVENWFSELSMFAPRTTN